MSMRLTAAQHTRLPQAAATERLPVVCLARHGQTAWTISHQHTGVEGRTTAEIHAERPSWQLFRDGCPGGESPEEVATRAGRVIRRVQAIGGDVLLFSSGHFLRMFAARWLGLDPGAGRHFVLGTASLSEMGDERDRSEPVIWLWGEMHHERRGDKQHARNRETT